jgi:hypothetical protein
MNAQTSDRVASIAARFLTVKAETLMALTAKQSTAEILAADIRSMAASLLRQDEVKGIRKLIRKVTGR